MIKIKTFPEEKRLAVIEDILNNIHYKKIMEKHQISENTYSHIRHKYITDEQKAKLKHQYLESDNPKYVDKLFNKELAYIERVMNRGK